MLSNGDRSEAARGAGAIVSVDYYTLDPYSKYGTVLSPHTNLRLDVTA